MKKPAYFSMLPVYLLSASVSADYKEDIRYTLLQAEVGASIPTGTGIAVTQVEAAIGASETNVGAWMPDAGASFFTGKTILDQSTPSSDGISSHSTGVARLFYGNEAMVHGITDIDVYSAIDWVDNGYLKTTANIQPMIGNSRVTNHSWVGSASTAAESVSILKRVDWVVEEDESIQVVAMNNSSNQPFIGSAFNSISVGKTTGSHAQSSLGLDSIYTAGRTKPDVVVPVAATSSATPIVSAAATLLIEQAHVAAEGATSVISNGDVIYNGERSEVIKAVIMAGADRKTSNTFASEQITDYRADLANQTDNGLDKRYGAGQLNVYNNYQIMAAGEKDSQEDGGAATIGLMGYDYDESFGGAGSSNGVASYLFESITEESMELTASLVWNIDIEDTPGSGFNPVAELNDLNLYLYDVTGGANNLLASSVSTTNNTENLWVYLQQDHDYELVVSTVDGSSFNWDYGLAWKVTPVPVPAAIWFFMAGLVGLIGQRRYIQNS